MTKKRYYKLLSVIAFLAVMSSTCLGHSAISKYESNKKEDTRAELKAQAQSEAVMTGAVVLFHSDLLAVLPYSSNFYWLQLSHSNSQYLKKNIFGFSHWAKIIHTFMIVKRGP